MRNKSKPASGWISLFLIVAGCSAAERAEQTADVVGRLEDKKIVEASGLARSQRQPGLLWVVNDHGAKNVVHALDHEGGRMGEFLLKKTKTRDWEDLGSFRQDEKPFLMIADIGDNDAERKYRSLYFVAEPVPSKDGEEKPNWQVDFIYPDGPRDAEAAAIDVDNETVLILTKRDLPPQLYEVPLRPDSKGKVTANSLGVVTSLPRPSRQDFEFAAKTGNLYWQPVGMDISQDNLAAVILTYGDVYYYRRRPQQSWYEVLKSKAERKVSLGNFENAESIAFAHSDDDNGRIVFVTGENKHARLLRIDFSGESTL
jgi:hypothetical protein